MPRTRQTETPAQRRWVAVLMVAVFAGSMVLAWLTTGATGARGAASVPSAQRVTLNGLSLAVPGGWRQDRGAARQLGLESGVVFIDPQRTQRRLVVAQVRVAERAGPGEVLKAVMNELLAPAQWRTYKWLMPPQPRELPEAGLVGVEAAGRSLARSGRSAQLHLSAVLTAEGARHWLVYLTDAAESEQAMGERFDQGMQLLRQIESSARPAP